MVTRSHLNASARDWQWSAERKSASDSQVLSFHQAFPSYDDTPLHDLPAIAKELGLGRVFLKDESNRFGLPSFKILGASWAVFRALLDKLDLPSTTSGQTGGDVLSGVGAQAKEAGVRLVTCTEGNWGRAVSRTANYLGIQAKIFVPYFMPETTRARIRSEGAEVIVLDGHYDDTVAAARSEAAADEKALLVMDMGWDGYEKIPVWVVEGYSTMLAETDQQLQNLAQGRTATHAFVPVGVGSIAQAVTEHYKRAAAGSEFRATVSAVEPTTAACLKSSLEAGSITTISTGNTIMCGMNCGTVSSTAWPVLRAGVDAAITVSDAESHHAVEELSAQGIHSGPCGAATLAALRMACATLRDELNLGEESVVVLFCTEGAREYEIPT